MSDSLIRILFDGCPVRAELVRLDASWRQAIAYQNLPRPAAVLGGEMTAAAVLLAAIIKFDGTTALQAQGNGPVGLVMSEVSQGLAYRTVVRLRQNAAVPESTPAMPLHDLLDPDGAGRCAVILDAADRARGTQPYQGVVSLASGNVSTAIEAYMAQSEQLETRLWLASDGLCAAGLMLQKMPDLGGDQPQNDDPQAWERIGMLASTLTDAELLALPPEDLAARLFAGERARLIGRGEPRFVCRCSEETIRRMLVAVGKDEVEKAIAQGGVSVTCGFCGKVWKVPDDQARALFPNA